MIIRKNDIFYYELIKHSKNNTYVVFSSAIFNNWRLCYETATKHARETKTYFIIKKATKNN